MEVYIWGTGKKCRDMIDSKTFDVENVSGYIETEKSADEFRGKRLYSFEEIVNSKNYEYIFVTIRNNDSVYNLLKENCVDLNRICFAYPCEKEKCIDKNLKIAEKILTHNGYISVCENYGIADCDWIISDAEKYGRLNKRDSFNIITKYNYYITEDKFQSAGSINSYFWQDLWAAKKIISSNPKQHFDIGSRIDGFIAHLLAADITVNLIDIRPWNINIENLLFTCADATNLNGIDDNSIDSLSALCSLEHFGLGRYGDMIDPEACFKAFEAIQRKVKLGGNIYVAVPIGKEHLEFNAHRVFYASTVVECFDKCNLLEFSMAKNDEYEENINIHKYDYDASLGGARFGLFHFIKRV